MTKFKVAVLASHTGSNLQALHEASLVAGSGFEIALIMSNNSAARALLYAQAHGVPSLHLSAVTHPGPGELDAAMHGALVEHGIDLVVTAGYMRKVGPDVLAAYENRIVNVHPALLPRHGGPGMYGAAVHQAVLAAGDAVSGPSVHFVTAEYDAGEVIAQSEVPVLAGDTVESLAARVLAEEHTLLPATVRRLAVEAAGRHSGGRG
ncbi:phosphoribosylglycinamide formyltransferase [Kitasatospora sp. McL0602]|uniref:phosphoribosylglycinamide formyltransferase n=1 Tax=Kitasatospora sp. McL0602 TaxID=3439530 RepID=UPI003F88E85A